MTPLEILFWLLLLYLLYTYAGYPVILYILSALFRRGREDRVNGDDPLPRITVLIPAHNEEGVIEKKVMNALSCDYPEDLLEVVVSSDGSSDQTVDLVKGVKDPRVVLVENPVRRGKPSAIASGFRMAKGEVIVLTDANVFFEKGALRRLITPLRDPDVAAVSGDVRLRGKAGYGPPQSLYYLLERFVQRRESLLSSIIGVDGGMYAVRRGDFTPPPGDMILDDFIISMEIAKRGRRVVYEEGAAAYEETPARAGREFRRKVRVEAGNFQSLLAGWGVPGSGTPLLLFQYLSHKLMRWFAFIPLLLIPLLLPLLFGRGPFYRIFFILYISFCLVALFAAFYLKRVRGGDIPFFLSFPFYFAMENLAALFGLYMALRGRVGAIWEKER